MCLLIGSLSPRVTCEDIWILLKIICLTALGVPCVGRNQVCLFDPCSPHPHSQLSRTELDMWLVSTSVVWMREHVGNLGEDVWVRQTGGEETWGWIASRISSERDEGSLWHGTDTVLWQHTTFNSQSGWERERTHDPVCLGCNPTLTQALTGHLTFQSLSFFLELCREWTELMHKVWNSSWIL